MLAVLDATGLQEQGARVRQLQLSAGTLQTQTALSQLQKEPTSHLLNLLALQSSSTDQSSVGAWLTP